MPANPKLIVGLLLLTFASSLVATANPGQTPRLVAESLNKDVMAVSYLFDSTTGEIKPHDTFSFGHGAIVKNRRVVKMSGWIKPGQMFFPRGSAANRFLLKKIEQKEIKNPRTGTVEIINLATIEDRKENQTGTLYKLRKGSRYGIIIRDWTVTLRYKETRMRLQEGETFTIPPGDKKGDLHTFKGVNDDAKVVITFMVDDKEEELIIEAPQTK